MIAVLILVCAASIAVPDCTPDTAIHVLRGPDAPSPLTCGRNGQAYVAETALGRGLPPGAWLKIVCQRADRMAPPGAHGRR
ncbi:MAG TPA: hypothetical protein VF194_06255 [Ferrovibrio sp.]|jgi:hypothetical protein|uniref:hypothetical protein n=1 Tax=Ferrovibrio sp. TaxID=1917215 RepID=UPI002ED2DF75